MPEEKRVTVHVSRELHSKAKAAAALQGKTLSDVVRDCLYALTGLRPKGGDAKRDQPKK